MTVDDRHTQDFKLRGSATPVITLLHEKSTFIVYMNQIRSFDRLFLFLFFTVVKRTSLDFLCDDDNIFADDFRSVRSQAKLRINISAFFQC